ncbi:MAG: hypothetical protein Q9190_002435, partial [Brigantiaea leucoxantha]
DVTILVPNNDAFNKIPYSSLGPAFKANQSDIIRSVLQYHVLPGLHPSGSYNGSFSFDTTWLQNSSYTNVTGGQVVGGVRQAGDVNVFISGVGSRSTMVQSVRLSLSPPFVNPILLTFSCKQDLAFDGGIVHAIDTFLIPPQPFVATAPTFNLTAAGGAITNASLDTYTNEHKDLTIFVPQNSAWQSLGATLQTMPLSELQDILDYHIVNGTHFIGYSANLPNATILRSRQGSNLTITSASNSLFVNSARIIQPDLLISNGVMHVIDNFLNPNASAVTAQPELPTQPPVLQGSAISGNVVPFTEDLPTSVTSFSSSATAGASSFGVGDIGGAATTTSDGSAATTTGAESTRSSKKKNGAERVEFGNVGTLGGVVGGLLFILGIL